MFHPQSTKKLSVAEALRGARETRVLEVGSNILSKTPEVFRSQFGTRTAIIIDDKNTFRVAGETVAKAFAAAGHACLPPYIFTDPNLYAEMKFVDQLESALKEHDAIPVAVGSGAINDITKLAAQRVGRPYMVVGTAASMDGYTAFGSSITYKGSKQTFNCPAPVAVIADIEIMRAAPPLMNASGYADITAKIPAGADWILADALGVEPIHEESWNIAQGRLTEALKDPSGVHRGDATAVSGLVEGLMLGGFAMQSSKTSRPASGAEHQFSHLWDMEHHTHNGEAPSHGFKVGIGTLASTGLYEFLLKQPIQNLDVDRCCERWPNMEVIEAEIRVMFKGEDFVEKAIEEVRAKYISAADLRGQLQQLRQLWPELKSALQAQLRPRSELKQMLADVGAPHEPEQIGISRERLRNSFKKAYFIRRRFTVLDVAVRTGLLESALNELFGPKGVWPVQASTASKLAA